MANPNIVSVASIYGKTVSMAVTTTNTLIVTNPSNSGKILKINTVIVTNVDGTSAADITVTHEQGENTTRIASTISVPADSSLTIIDKSTSFYLEEGRSIGALASANGDLEILISYEEIA
jgi:hypothetical protein